MCQKLKNGVGFPCHDRISMILGLPYTGNIRLSPSVPFEGYKWDNSELWKRGEIIQL
jgi:hypothetical protein